MSLIEEHTGLLAVIAIIGLIVYCAEALHKIVEVVQE